MTTSINVNTYNVYLASSLSNDEDDFNRLANQAEEALDAYNNDVKSGQSTAISGPVMIAALQQLAAHWHMSAQDPVGTPPTDPVELKIYNQLISHCLVDSTSSLSAVLFGDPTTALDLFAKTGNKNLFMPTQGSDSIYNDIDASGNVKTDQGHYSDEIKTILDEINIYQHDYLTPSQKTDKAAEIARDIANLANDLKNGRGKSVDPATDGFLTAISQMLNTTCSISGTSQTLLNVFTTGTPDQIQAALDSGGMSDLQIVLSDAQKWDS